MEPSALIVPAFIAGLFTFLAPCTLPMVPAYLGFLSGISAQEAAAAHSRRLRRRIFLGGLSFVLGFSTVFIVLGVFAGSVGMLFPGAHEWITRIGGVLVILFGLMMLGILNLSFLSREHRVRFSVGKGSGMKRAFLLGAAFGTGWTPCIGPVLGAILTLAASSAGAAHGALLLGVFAFGLSIPFLVAALALGQAESFIQRATPYLGIVTRVSGALIVLLGLVLLFDAAAVLNAYLYNTFSFLNYGALLRFF